MKTLISALLVCGLASQVSAHAAHEKRPALIKEMQNHGCMMTPALASKVLPRLEIDPQTAVEFFGTMIEDGIAAFASDDETLLLLPPTCKA